MNRIGPKFDTRAYTFLKIFLLQSIGIVSFQGETSHKFNTSPRGFTQGATPSPVLFCTEMTEIHHRLSEECFTFADDANIIIKSNSKIDLKDKIKKATTDF